MNKIEKIGVQLFTVRNFMQNEKDIAETFKKLKALGYDQVQTAGCTISYEVYRELAEKADIEIIGSHENFASMYDDFEATMKNQQSLGVKLMGIGGYFREQEQKNLKEAELFIKKVNAVAEKIGQYGGKFTYHNHQREFVRLKNGKTIMDMLVEGMNPMTTSFVLDTYWVQLGGGDICEWIEKLTNRIDILHLKDLKIEPETNMPVFTEIGNGNFNWHRILEVAQKANVKYYVVEQDSCPGDPFDSLKISSEYLHKNFM